MKKLRLDPEALKVETFEPRSEGGDPRGTVFGRHLSTAVTCSVSVDYDCRAPEDTVTTDVYNDGCNTIACNDGGSFTGPNAGCATNAFC
jgi:hypothetical protein